MSTLAETDALVARYLSRQATTPRLYDAHGRALSVRNSTYDGAGTSRPVRMWQPPSMGPNDGLLGSLDMLRRRSRSAVRNDGYARMAIDRLVSNVVGTGITPQSKAPDPEIRARIHELWLDWTDESDADGALDFYGQQAQAVRAWLEGGEVFVRFRDRFASDGLSVPFQIELFESEQIDASYNGTNGANKIRAGIEFTPFGKRAAYWPYLQRPGDWQDMSTIERARVPADRMAHLYEPLRPKQIRGVPQLTQALVILFSAGTFRSATLTRQGLANMVLMFLKRTAPPPETVNPFGGESTTDEQGRRLFEMVPGAVQELSYDEDVKWSEPPDPSGYADFMRDTLMEAAVAAGVPYEVLTGDLRNVNDRTVRVVLNEFRRRVEQHQHHLVAFQFNRVVYNAFITKAVQSGALRMPAAYFEDPRPWQRVEWVPPAWPYLHPVQDVQAYRDMVRSGAMTLGEMVQEMRGRSLEAVLAERAEELQMLDGLGIITDTDPRRTASRGAAQPAEDVAGVSAETSA